MKNKILQDFLKVVEDYSSEVNIMPSTILAHAISAGSDRFEKLKSETTDIGTVQILRVFMWIEADRKKRVAKKKG
jgi:hypothetical protein|tara:strand:- start:1150 stop:1374 length:225 start_codon:yes stop_codon:yes gene_type:complete